MTDKPREFMRNYLALVFWLCVLASPAGAETVYVGDRFEIGVHDATSIDSVILAVIASGTPLTVTNRDGEFVEVTTPEGIKGWVDARYVVAEKPSVALLEERDAKLKEAVRSLGAAHAEIEVLRQRVSELKRDAATAAHNAPDIAKPVSLAPNADTAKLEKVNRELEKSADEIRQLKSRVEDLQAAQAASQAMMADNATKPGEATQVMEQTVKQTMDLSATMGSGVGTWTTWQWLLFGSILLLAFAAGGYAVDWESRRRHGGFRI
jgi:SH3 domain protein